jgi:hypothetical protein
MDICNSHMRELEVYLAPELSIACRHMFKTVNTDLK